MTQIQTIDLAANLRRVQERIAKAAGKVGRQPEEVTIIGATKTLEVDRIRPGIAAGLKHLGENYVQEAREKSQQLAGEDITWHFIGHLQRNKVKQAVEIFEWIDSVDSLRLAEEISKRAAQRGREVKVLLEINTSGEESKFGIPPEAAPELAEQVCHLPAMRLLGLMTMAALVPDPEAVRPCFVRLRELADAINRLKLPGVEMRELSMGMTNDFEVAVEEGATMVRIGTAIFGPRET